MSRLHYVFSLLLHSNSREDSQWLPFVVEGLMRQPLLDYFLALSLSYGPDFSVTQLYLLSTNAP